MFTVNLLLFCLLNAILVGAKDNISIYYETLCPDSIRFITTQFYPSFKYIENYVNVDFIPFGNAKATNSSGQWQFQCQHGPQECYGNKVHSCTVSFYNTETSLAFINCAMNCEDPNSDYTFEKCASENNVFWTNIKDCLSSGKADDLLAENGEKTKSVNPPITYIPTITFNNFYNRTTQDEFQTHFMKYVCELLTKKPSICQYLDIFVGLVV